LEAIIPDSRDPPLHQRIGVPAIVVVVDVDVVDVEEVEVMVVNFMVVIDTGWLVPAKTVTAPP
jgi:hypothetical protein